MRGGRKGSPWVLAQVTKRWGGIVSCRIDSCQSVNEKEIEWVGIPLYGVLICLVLPRVIPCMVPFHQNPICIWPSKRVLYVKGGKNLQNIT